MGAGCSDRQVARMLHSLHAVGTTAAGSKKRVTRETFPRGPRALGVATAPAELRISGRERPESRSPGRPTRHLILRHWSSDSRRSFRTAQTRWIELFTSSTVAAVATVVSPTLVDVSCSSFSD